MSFCDVSQEFYTENLVKARKLHKCCECREEIDPGEKYYRISAMWDGERWNGAQHVYCYHFARSLNSIDARGRRYPVYASKRDPDFESFGAVSGMWRKSYWQHSPLGTHESPIDECVPFEGVSEFLSEIGDLYDPESDALVEHPAQRFWASICSGCRERFGDGSGI